MRNSTENVNKVCGERIKECREHRKLTREQLAKDAFLSPRTIAAIENGSRNLTKSNAILIGNILGVSPEYLLGESNYKNLSDEWNHVNDEIARECDFMVSAIRSLALLNGYELKCSDPADGTLYGYFKARREMVTFVKDGQEVFTLSDSALVNMGNLLSDFFMSNIKWNILPGKNK